jgi:hypothetical protein
MPTEVKIVNRYTNAFDFSAQRPRERVNDAAGNPVLDSAGKLQYTHYPERRIQLERGAHAVDSELLEYILTYNSAAAEIFDKWCTIEDAPPAGGTREYTRGDHVSDLSTLTIAAALAAIKACNEPAQLAEWLMQDARAPVKKALHLRDRELRPGDEDEQG